MSLWPSRDFRWAGCRGCISSGEEGRAKMEVGESLAALRDVRVGLSKRWVSGKEKKEMRLERWWCQAQEGLGCWVKEAGLCP